MKSQMFVFVLEQYVMSIKLVGPARATGGAIQKLPHGKFMPGAWSLRARVLDAHRSVDAITSMAMPITTSNSVSVKPARRFMEPP